MSGSRQVRSRAESSPGGSGRKESIFGRRSGPPTHVVATDAAMEGLSSLAKEIAQGGVKSRRELKSFMMLEEGGGRRLFRHLASRETSATVERLLRGDGYQEFSEGGASLTEREASRTALQRPVIASGKEVREAVEIEEWMFDESADPVRKIVLEAPFLVDANNEPSAVARNMETSEWYAAGLSKRDVALDVVTARLGDVVRKNREKIARGVEVVGEVEMGATHASVQTTNARRKLNLACRDTVVDVLALLQMRRRRERAAQVLAVALTAKNALASLVDVAASAGIANFSRVVSAASAARDALETEPLQGLHALNAARADAKAALPKLRFAVDRHLWRATDADALFGTLSDSVSGSVGLTDGNDARVVRSKGSTNHLRGSASAMSAALAARLDAIVEAYAAIDDNDDDGENAAEQNAIADGPTSDEVLCFLEDESNAYDPQGHDDKMPRRLWRLVPAGLRGLGERVDVFSCHRFVSHATTALGINDTTESLIAARNTDPLSVRIRPTIEPTQLAECVIQLSGRVVDGVDTLRRVAAWYTSTYEADGFQTDEDEDSNDDLKDKKQPPDARHGASRILHSPRRQRQRALRRMATRPALNAGLRASWRLGSACLTAALRRSAPEASKRKRPSRLEDAAAAFMAVHVARCLARASNAAGDADTIETERGKLREAGRDYLRAVRRDALGVLAQMLDCEPWCSLSHIEQVELFSYSYSSSIEKKTDDAAAADREETGLVDGDPFANPEQIRLRARRLELSVVDNLARTTRGRLIDLSKLFEKSARSLACVDSTVSSAVAELVLSRKSSRHLDDTTDRDCDVVVKLVDDAKAFLDALPEFGLLEPCARGFAEALANIRRNKSSFCGLEPDASVETDGWVATQAAYHGLCKTATRYAQIALLIDGAEDEVVDALLELFDVYAKHVALTFVPASKLRALARKVRGGDEACAETDDDDEILACDVDGLEALCKFADRVGLFEVAATHGADEQPRLHRRRGASPKSAAGSLLFSPHQSGKNSPKTGLFGGAAAPTATNSTAPTAAVSIQITSGLTVASSSRRLVEDDHATDCSETQYSDLLADLPTVDDVRESVIAARSLRFAAAVLRSAVACALDRATPGRKSAAKRRLVDVCAAAEDLRKLVYRSLGPNLAGADAVVRAIRDAKDNWAAKTIQEECNDYVDLAAKRFDRLWTSLCYLDRRRPNGAPVSPDDRALPSSSSSSSAAAGPPSAADARGRDVREEDRELLWTEAVQSAFEALVDGFALVEHCSTEGRALMSMDLQVLQFSLDKIHRARPVRAAIWVDSYIKAFYFAEDDLLSWINQNRSSYKERHVLCLLQSRLSKTTKKRKNNIKDFLLASMPARGSS